MDKTNVIQQEKVKGTCSSQGVIELTHKQKRSIKYYWIRMPNTTHHWQFWWHVIL